MKPPAFRSRRTLLQHALAAPLLAPLGALAPVRAVQAAATTFTPVVEGMPLVFPRDFGAHPGFRTEWWYMTGWLARPDGRPCGFQLTFFRSRTAHDEANPSRFAPKQLLFGHAALALPERAHLVHAQCAARAGLGLAWAREGNTDVAIDDWSLQRQDGRYLVAVTAAELSMHLEVHPDRPPIPQGRGGFSQKGPRPEQASYYYSEPQLRVAGRIAVPDLERGTPLSVTGTAWLDHEWSSTLLDPAAVGWDWIGINLHDGSSLMAFRIRTRTGDTLWSHAAWTDASGTSLVRGESRWQPVRQWRSPRSGAIYPVGLQVTVGKATLKLDPLMDDQEVDARASTGTVYWEGAVRLRYQNREIGRGYLELTGYAAALKL